MEFTRCRCLNCSIPPKGIYTELCSILKKVLVESTQREAVQRYINSAWWHSKSSGVSIFKDLKVVVFALFQHVHPYKGGDRNFSL